jgi:plasmid maintenance system antidote protein VapI
MTITDQLIDAIKKNGESISEIARQTEIDRTHLTRFINGQRSLTLPQVDRLIKYLKLTLKPEK